MRVTAGDDLIVQFVQRATCGVDGRAARCALFTAVRNLPYATNGASDAVELVRMGRGNCLAKADLLLQGFQLLGYGARRVRWRYQLPEQPPEVALLPSRDDIHTAVEVQLGGRWILVDATHDPPLVRGDFIVNTWDGERPTAPAYQPQGPVWREGEDAAAIAGALAVIDAQYRGWSPAHAGADRPSYGQAFNAWLEQLRAPQSSPASVTSTTADSNPSTSL